MKRFLSRWVTVLLAVIIFTPLVAQTADADGKAAMTWGAIKAERNVAAAPGEQHTAMIHVQPIRGRHVGGGKTLWVHVYVDRGKGAGKGGGKPKPPPDCSDANVFAPANLHGWQIPAKGIRYTYNQYATPGDIVISEVATAINDTLATWSKESAGLSLSVTSLNRGQFIGPAADGDHLVGFARFTGKGAKQTLAAAWTWVDEATNVVTDTDIFFNTSHKWAVNEKGSGTCGISDRYDVGNVFTHEVGHPVGVGHSDDSTDPNRQATMAPTAEKGELRKVTLSDYDLNGLAIVYGP